MTYLCYFFFQNISQIPPSLFISFATMVQATVFFHTDCCKQSPCGSLLPTLTRSPILYKEPRKFFRNINQKTMQVRSTVNICLIGVLCLEHCVLLCLINSYSSFTIKFRYSFQNPDHQFSSFLTRLGWISVCVPKAFYASLHQDHFISFTMLCVTCLHSVVFTRLWVA